MALTPLESTTQGISLVPQRAFDSRGRPTVGVTAHLNSLSAYGDVPAGASKGADEAHVVSVEDAMAHMAGPIAQHVASSKTDLRDPAQIMALDASLAALAGENFALWGANGVLPVSRALWRLGAQLRGEPLWATLRAAMPQTAPGRRTKFFLNVFNGGLHALKKKDGEQLGRDRISIQEIMVVPWRAGDYQEALAMGDALDQALHEELLAHYDEGAITRADEAGFTVLGLGDSDRAILHVKQAIERAGFVPGIDVKLALDVAAGSFFDPTSQTYRLVDKAWTTQQMIEWLTGVVDRYPHMFVSIEDGLAEDDWSGWTQLSDALGARGVLTIGDDLFVTQLPRLKRGVACRAAHAILIKVNQNGTVGGTLEVAAQAQAAGMACVVSHRSGETLDDSIADLAVGIGALGLKSGDTQPPKAFSDPHTWVRRAKYLRMVGIDAQVSGENQL